ncbi:ATP-binding protein [Algoriphagus sp.]|uniref:tetratricopeptide repeat-containing sensor histidine kinase n=1 Tax=Algoriphagus sp. TaxID=1872435 RepID=UPI003918B4D5
MKPLNIMKKIVSLPIKTALLAFVMILIADESLAQQRAYINGPSENQIDSLLLRFSTETSGRLRMGLARELGLFYTDVDPDTTMYFVNTQLQLAQSLGERLWEGDALRRLGYLTYLQGSYSESFSYNTQALTLFMDTSTERKVWEPDRLSLAGTPEQARLTELALTYFHRAQLYTWISNISEQRPLYRKAIEIIDKAGDDAIASFMYGNLAESYIEEYPDSAMMYLSIGLEKSEKVGFMKYRGNDLSRMGRAHKSLNNFDSAEKYYLEAIAISREVNNFRHLAIAYYELARLNQLTGDTTRALDNALNSYEAADSIRNLAVISDVGLMLSKLYEQLNDTDNAYYFLRLSQAASETLQKENQIRRASDLQFAEQLRLRDLEEAQARSQARLRMTILMGVLFTIAVVAFLMYRNNRQKQAANKVLEKTLDNLKATQAQLVQQEKLASLGQLTAGIAHEIKNPLNFVNNFSEVSMEMIEEVLEARGEKREARSEKRDEREELEDEILEDIKANLRKIHEHGSRANGIVTSMLQHSRGGSGKMEPTDLNALIKEYVNLSFHGMRAGKNPIGVDIVFDLDPDLGMVSLIKEDFTRVVINLCNNAFDALRSKIQAQDLPGFQNLAGLKDYQPKLTVRTKTEKNQIRIAFEDNGPGIPDDIKDKILQPFFTTKKGTEGTGLGLSITHDIVKAHGGDIKINSTSDFTCIFIEMPSRKTINTTHSS